MIENITKTKYGIKFTSNFKKNYKKMIKQGKDKTKLKEIITKLANNEILEEKYRNHKLVNDKYYKECYECHIEPNWLLIYKFYNDNLLLILIDTGNHSELFK